MVVSRDRRFRRAIVRWLRRNTIGFAAGTAIMYLALIPASLLLFPNTNLVTTCLVLLTGLTSSVASLGALLVDLDE